MEVGGDKIYSPRSVWKYIIRFIWSLHEASALWLRQIKNFPKLQPFKYNIPTWCYYPSPKLRKETQSVYWQPWLPLEEMITACGHMGTRVLKKNANLSFKMLKCSEKKWKFKRLHFQMSNPIHWGKSYDMVKSSRRAVVRLFLLTAVSKVKNDFYISLVQSSSNENCSQRGLCLLVIWVNWPFELHEQWPWQWS